MSTVNLYTAVRAMLLDIINLTIFPAANIVQGFQPPSGNNFISYVRLDAHKTGITGVDTYIDDEVHTIYTRTNILLYENLIQIDFYSDDFYNASDAANLFHQYLTEFGTTFLDENYQGMSIGEVKDIVNNTTVGDKATYLPRYTQRFTLFTHEELTRNQAFIGDITVTPVFIN